MKLKRRVRQMNCRLCNLPLTKLRLDGAEGVEFVLACESCHCSLLCVMVEEFGGCELTDNGSFACRQCNDECRFESPIQCIRHFAANHQTQSPVTAGRVDRCYHCQKCSMYFLSINELNEHAKEHKEVYENEHAKENKEVHEKEHKEVHEKEHKKEHKEEHKKEKNNEEHTWSPEEQEANTLMYKHRCSSCGKFFRLLWRYKLHMAAASCSTDAASAKECIVCHKVFANNTNLYRHEMIHAGLRKHTCHVCGKSFVQKTQLVSHMTVHSGDRPYKCSQCGKQFSDRSTLRRHNRMHAKCDKFPCGVCGRVFSRRGYRDCHTKMHRGCAQSKAVCRTVCC